ncbi:hypothetical protein ACH5RR_031495 [Cinchona calisaya]|uniref:Uncharacterized protein n=1 Tax=Cinchona calisaya TaxID=153742 RepID=A0ABD2YFF4_9GENT
MKILTISFDNELHVLYLILYFKVELASAYDITLHHQKKQFRLSNIDPDHYSYINLLSDVCENALNRMSSGLNVMVALSRAIPDTIGRMSSDNDPDILKMFSLHRRSGCINAYVKLIKPNIDENNINRNRNNLGLNTNNGENNTRINGNKAGNMNILGGDGGNTNRVVRKKTKVNARKNTGISKRLGKTKEFTPIHNVEYIGNGNDIEGRLESITLTSEDTQQSVQVTQGIRGVMCNRTNFSSQRAEKIYGSPIASRLFGKDLAIIRDAIVKGVVKERKNLPATRNGVNLPDMEKTISANQGESPFGSNNGGKQGGSTTGSLASSYSRRAPAAPTSTIITADENYESEYAMF